MFAETDKECFSSIFKKTPITYRQYDGMVVDREIVDIISVESDGGNSYFYFNTKGSLLKVETLDISSF